MKRLIASVLALSLLSTAAATAANAGPANRPIPVRDYRHHDNNNGAAIAAGIGFLALAAILASSANRDHGDRYYRDRDYDRYDRYDRSYGYSQPYSQPYGYNQPYGYSQPYYDNRYDAYSHGYRGW